MNNILTIKNLSFSYTGYNSKTCLPSAGNSILHDINLSIPKGSFVTLCGATGSGKSTLLKLIKRDITPAGETGGNIYFNETNLADISAKELSARIGMVFQNPDDQIVTNKVWHEIAFGLESLGSDNDLVQQRLAEIMSFLRLEKLAYENTDELSGGQKQLVSLAGILAMYPDLLLLDEPTSQLDPENAELFIHTLKNIQRNLGMTVIIAEHNLENLLPVTDYLAVMAEGRIIAFGSPSDVISSISQDEPAFYDFPLTSRLGVYLNEISQAKDTKTPNDAKAPNNAKDQNDAKNRNNINIPMDVSSARILLKEAVPSAAVPNHLSGKHTFFDDSTDIRPAAELRNIYFRYSVKSSDILSDLSAKFYPGRIYALHGCNASGKSTLLGILGGWLRPQSGKIIYKSTDISGNFKSAASKTVDSKSACLKSFGFKSSGLKSSGFKAAYLPQNPDNLFVCETIEKDLRSVGLTPDKYPEYISSIDVKHSPFDLSGGEKQLLGLAKITAQSPDILLLDEPTKGTDKKCREQMLAELKNCRDHGVCVIMACHDMDFSAEFADECCIMSMGRLTEFLPAGDFFIRNRLYTTAARRISRDILPDLYREEELLSCLK